MRKRVSVGALLALVAITLWAANKPTGEIVVRWNYPWKDIGTGGVFRVYERTNVLEGAWLVLTLVPVTEVQPPTPGTDVVPFSTRVRVNPGLHYFALTYSNFWGESDFGEVVSTPALPRSDVKATVERVD